MNLIVSPVIACCFFPIYFYFVKDMQLTFMHVMWILAAEFTSMQEILHLLLLAGLEVPGKKKGCILTAAVFQYFTANGFS